MKIKKIILITSVFILFLGGQDLELQKADLEDEIEELKTKIKEEKKYFSKFKKEKENLLKQKKTEKVSLYEEISSYDREVDQLKREIKEVELRLEQIKKNNERINQRVKQLAETILESIQGGIPFDQDRRMAILNTLIMDIESGKTTARESFARLMVFLNSEELLGFDSQVFEKSIQVDGKYTTATILRIGRVFFAAQTEKGVFLYKKDKDRYLLDEKTSLDFFQRRNIDLAIKIIQGKKAPKLIDIPFYTTNIIKEGGN